MRRNAIAWLGALLAALLLVACSPDAANAPRDDASGPSSQASSASAVSEPRAKQAPSSSSSSTSTSASSSAETETPGEASVAFDLGQVEPYSGRASAEVNGNVPYFTAGDLARGQVEEYSPLDSLGRCGVACALVGPETMPDEPRGSIGMVKPSGWHTVRYDGLVDGNYLYNRCHLIGYQLTGENANERNLVTGTRTMNIVGMLPYEDRVAAYIERTGNHVLYRSTPLFEGADLVARGVLLEAESVEDAGAGVRFCAWCYNVEPGIEIDYSTGESRLAADAAALAAGGAPSDSAGAGAASAAEGLAVGAAASVSEPAAEEPFPSADADVRTYVLNTRSHKFHLPDCASVADMAEHNKQVVESTRDQIIANRYEPCKRCNP